MFGYEEQSSWGGGVQNILVSIFFLGGGVHENMTIAWGSIRYF